MHCNAHWFLHMCVREGEQVREEGTNEQKDVCVALAMQCNAMHWLLHLCVREKQRGLDDRKKAVRRPVCLCGNEEEQVSSEDAFWPVQRIVFTFLCLID